MSKGKDYIDYLEPIIDDVKDGSKENLTQDDVEFILTVIRAKIEYKEKLISKEQYEEIIYSTEV